jgi:hypothetical protein
MIKYNEINKYAEKILNHFGEMYTHHLGFNKELNNLEWVDKYVEDRKIQDEIDQLEKAIKEANACKISKKELRAWLDSSMKKYREFQLEQLKILMKQLQDREIPFFAFSNKIGGPKILGGDIHPYLFSLTDDEMDHIFKNLADGLTVQEQEAFIKENQARIDHLKAVREEKYSPQSRWIYKDTGEALPYPDGCRWTIYAEVWKRIAPRFRQVVDVTGHKATTQRVFDAYVKLGLHELKKSEPPMDPFN